MTEEKDKWDVPARLFNLLATVIMVGRKGISKEQIFKVVPAYRDDLAKGTSEESVSKKFERDKAILRENGFAFDVNVNDHNISLYSIPQRDFAWPEGTKLSAQQLQLLQLASKVWSEAAVSKDAGAAVIRLKALGMAGESEQVFSLQPQIEVHDPAFLPLSHAIADRAVVRFKYRKPGQSTVLVREVHPWAMKNIGGQWMLTSWDTARESVRNFLLKRIVSKVEVVKPENSSEPRRFPAPTPDQLETAERELDELVKANVAKLEILKGSEAWFRYVDGESNDGEWVTHERNFMDLYLLAEELREFGRDVRVLEPAALIEAVNEGYRKLLEAHA